MMSSSHLRYILGGWEVGGSITPTAALFTALLGSRVLKRPMGVSGCDPGHNKAGGYALFWVAGWT